MDETTTQPERPSRPSLVRRFWRDVAKWGASPDECWLWTGACAASGYGVIGDGRRVVTAHRLSWAFALGPIPPKHSVLHRCDNPPCVNPAHLFLGTQADNMADMARKGRQGGTKLTAADVREIKRLRQGGLSQRKVAARYGVSQTLIHYLDRGLWWKEVK